MLDFNSTIDAPHMVKEFGDYIYVSIISAGKFLKIRKSDNQIVAEVLGLEKPGMIQINLTGTKAYVSRSSTSPSIYNTIYVIDLTSMSLVKRNIFTCYRCAACIGFESSKHKIVCCKSY